MDTARTLKLELILIYAAHCGGKYYFGEVVYKLTSFKVKPLVGHDEQFWILNWYSPVQKLNTEILSIFYVWPGPWTFS